MIEPVVVEVAIQRKPGVAFDLFASSLTDW